MQDHEQNQTRSSQLRLKCIVLGSAGAGKTSILRRYIHGTFEGHTGHDTLSRSNNKASNRRRGRVGTTSTLGADYYVKKVENPLLREVHDDASGSNNSGSGSRHIAKKKSSHGMDTADSHVLVQLWDTAGKERLKPQKKSAQYDHLSNFHQFLSIRRSSSTNNSNYEHRYNNWGFLNGINDQEPQSSISSYHHHENTIHNNNEHEEKVYSQQQHNTQHKHGHHLHNHRHNVRYSQTNQNPNEPMGDALFRNIDACMLVYDATSSMSFLHLMQWHSEWVLRLNNWEREETEKDQTKTNNASDDREKENTGRRKRIPFIVVANKIDLLEEDQEKSKKIRSSVRQERRSVMGFSKDYRGKELKYEYAAENTKIPQSRRQLHCDTALATKQVGKNNPPADRLTYNLKENLWSTDATYLNALNNTEDQLPANRNMILLWCQRNGIPHVEASALNGTGVVQAIEHLVKIAVEELEIRETERSERRRDQEERMPDRESTEQEMSRQMRSNWEDVVYPEASIPESTGPGISTQYTEKSNVPQPNSICDDKNNVASGADSTTSGVDPSQYYFLYQPRQEEKLDLFARYSPKDEQRCSPFKCWPPLISYCQR